MLKKQTANKKTKKDENSYFIILLKKSDLLFASWKIDNEKWKSRIETAEADPVKKHYLYIDILSVEGGNYKKIDSLPVHGLENQWHIFTKKEYFGKKLMLRLTYVDKKGKSYDILNSSEIDIPPAVDRIEESQADEEKILFELSEINFSGKSGSTSPSSW